MTPDDLAIVPPARLPFPITRAVPVPIDAEADADADGMPTLHGHFSTFGDWYEVNSLFEGNFIESVSKRAFDKTIRESRGQMKVLFDHGQDPQIGNKILGSIESLSTDDIGPAYTVPLYDTSYNRDLAPGLIAGAYGSSFRFSVEKDVWDHSPEPSDYNPSGLPERTITEARVFEFGPVTFPANSLADAGARSTTDAYYKRSKNPEQFEDLLRSATLARTSTVAEAYADAVAEAAAPSTEPPPVTPPEPTRADTPRTVQPEPPAPDPAPEPSAQEGTVEQLFTIEEKRARINELTEALERQAAHPGVLPPEEQSQWDADVAEHKELIDDVRAFDARQQVLEDRAIGKPEEVERTFEPPTVRQINRKSEADLYSFEERGFRNLDERARAWQDDALKIVQDVTKFPDAVDADKSRERITGLLEYNDSPDKELARRIKATGAPLYRRAFEKIIKAQGETYSLTPEEQRGTALAVGVDGTGGFTVPFAFDPTIIAIGAWTGAVNPFRRACRVVSIVGTDTWNALTSTAVVATRTTEAAAAIEQGPTFAQPQYIVKRVQGQITASFEMFQDRADLGSEMSVLIQEAKDNEEEASFSVGAGAGTASLGVGPVNGTSGAYTSITTAGSLVLAAADFDAVEAALPVRHRFGAQWFLNRLSIRRAQTLETAGGKLFGGQQYQAVGIPELDRAGNTGLRLLGYPVNESPSLPTAQTANIVIGTLLAPQSYVIVERVGMSVQFIPFILNSSSLATGQQALYFLWRNHAAPINVDAGRTLRYLT
jgi:HK97 family phage major capsid protein/HK97 family phage prohead protease